MLGKLSTIGFESSELELVFGSKFLEGPRLSKLGFPSLGTSFELGELRWNTDVDVLGVDGATSVDPHCAAQVNSVVLLGEGGTSTISPSLGSFVGRSRLGEEL
jgi:hypothetical protein